MRMCVLSKLIMVLVPDARKYENKMRGKKVIPTIYRLG